MVKYFKMVPNPKWRCTYCHGVSAHQFVYENIHGEKLAIIETCDECYRAEVMKGME